MRWKIYFGFREVGALVKLYEARACAMAPRVDQIPGMYGSGLQRQ